MEEEPDQQNIIDENTVDKTKKIGYDTANGREETTIDEQEIIEMLIKEFDNLNPEDQLEPDLNDIHNQERQIDVSDIENFESIEEEPYIDENLEINTDFDAPVLDNICLFVLIAADLTFSTYLSCSFCSSAVIICPFALNSRSSVVFKPDQ